MENQVVLKIEGIKSWKAANKVVKNIGTMPGVALVNVDLNNGYLRVTGGDLDQLQIADMVEGMGYHTFH